MAENPLASLEAYSRFAAQSLDRADVSHSTVSVWSDSPFTGTAEGEVIFSTGIRLRMREELDFESQLITSYGYEVYRGEERLFWYDDFPHPNDPTLASTFPHHKHIPPDIKHHRVPAPGIGFESPNLPRLVEEILLLG
ncbi:MAG: DUF6516 family protein [Chloroflexota bacterium]